MDIDKFRFGCVKSFDNYNNTIREHSSVQRLWNWQWLLFLWLWVMIKMPLASKWVHSALPHTTEIRIDWFSFQINFIIEYSFIIRLHSSILPPPSSSLSSSIVPVHHPHTLFHSVQKKAVVFFSLSFSFFPLLCLRDWYFCAGVFFQS